jgi:hypothetical protein
MNLHGLGKRIVCLVHVSECVAAGLRGHHGVKRSSLSAARYHSRDRYPSPGMWTRPSSNILIADVVDLRTFEDSEARTVVQKDLVKDLHRFQKPGVFSSRSRIAITWSREAWFSFCGLACGQDC